MNIKLLNVVSLDDGRIIKKGASGGGGGNTPGGGGGDTPTPDIPVIGDGKTYLYIKIAEKGRMDVPLYFSQTVANGVTIDWGDGSAPQTLSGTGKVNTTHLYADVGEYTISLNPADGCTLGLGRNSSSYCVMGSAGDTGRVYGNMLQAVEIGKNVPSIGSNTFYYCYSLTNVVIPNSVTIIESDAFSFCSSLASVVIPNNVIFGRYIFSSCYSLASVTISDGIKSIGDHMFSRCYSLASVVIPNSVTEIRGGAFEDCRGMAFYDFRAAKSVPTLPYASAFASIPSDCKIVVPDSLYDEWIAATNWSAYASKIVKASEFNA